MNLRGDAYGESYQAIEEHAHREAKDFFGECDYSLQIDDARIFEKNGYGSTIYTAEFVAIRREE